MANHEWEDEADRWVDERVAGLGPGREWMPDAARTLARLRDKNRARAVSARRWMWTSLAAAGVGAALLLLPASRACAEQPDRCVQRVLGGASAVSHVPAVPRITPPLSAPNVSTPPRKITSPWIALSRNFKEIGNAAAPVSVEIYLDYECAHCGTFVRDVVPVLAEQYVMTGKVKLLYRDYPMATHRFAKLAARYADAAGELGYYDAAMKQLFATREIWSASGDIESQLAEVLPEGAMAKLRRQIAGDSDPEACLLVDLAAGHADHLDRTPFVVIVSGETRQAITDAPLTFEVLKRDIEELVRN